MLVGIGKQPIDVIRRVNCTQQQYDNVNQKAFAQKKQNEL